MAGRKRLPPTHASRCTCSIDAVYDDARASPVVSVPLLLVRPHGTTATNSALRRPREGSLLAKSNRGKGARAPLLTITIATASHPTHPLALPCQPHLGLCGTVLCAATSNGRARAVTLQPPRTPVPLHPYLVPPRQPAAASFATRRHLAAPPHGAPSADELRRSSLPCTSYECPRTSGAPAARRCGRPRPLRPWQGHPCPPSSS